MIYKKNGGLRGFKSGKLTHWKRLKIQTRDSHGLAVGRWAFLTLSFSLGPPSVSEARPPEFVLIYSLLLRVTSDI